MMGYGDSTFNFPRDIAQFLGGLLMLAIVGVLAFGSVVWSAVAGRKRR